MDGRHPTRLGRRALWTVVEPLENGCFKWAVAFPPTRRLRYLHLSPAAPVAEPWTIAETEALE